VFVVAISKQSDKGGKDFISLIHGLAISTPTSRTACVAATSLAASAKSRDSLFAFLATLSAKSLS
jgi:hypothetical protein